MDMITIKVKGEEKNYPAGTDYRTVAAEYQD